MSIAIIPARGGSTRIPRKNIRPFHGKPIICYSIEAARKSWFDMVVISTDDQEVAKVAADAGAEIHWRSPELCENDIGTQEVVRCVLSDLNVRNDELVCCLYPCAPLLTAETLINAKELFYDHGKTYVFSVTTTGNMKFVDAGQFYLGRPWAFNKRVPLEGKDSILVVTDTIDINTEADWQAAEALYESRK